MQQAFAHAADMIRTADTRPMRIELAGWVVCAIIWYVNAEPDDFRGPSTAFIRASISAISTPRDVIANQFPDASLTTVNGSCRSGKTSTMFLKWLVCNVLGEGVVVMAGPHNKNAESTADTLMAYVHGLQRVLEPLGLDDMKAYTTHKWFGPLHRKSSNIDKFLSGNTILLGAYHHNDGCSLNSLTRYKTPFQHIIIDEGDKLHYDITAEARNTDNLRSSEFFTLLHDPRLKSLMSMSATTTVRNVDLVQNPPPYVTTKCHLQLDDVYEPSTVTVTDYMFAPYPGSNFASDSRVKFMTNADWLYEYTGVMNARFGLCVSWVMAHQHDGALTPFLDQLFSLARTLDKNLTIFSIGSRGLRVFSASGTSYAVKKIPSGGMPEYRQMVDEIRCKQTSDGLANDKAPIIVLLSQLGKGMRLYTTVWPITHLHVRNNVDIDVTRQWIERANKQPKPEWLRGVRVVLPNETFLQLESGMEPSTHFHTNLKMGSFMGSFHRPHAVASGVASTARPSLSSSLGGVVYKRCRTLYSVTFLQSRIDRFGLWDVQT